MRQRAIAWLRENVNEHRLQHILGVESTSVALARCHSLDTAKAGQAGLLHDLAKFFKPKTLLEMAREEGIEIDPLCAEHPHLLHADVSAIVAREEFGIADREILDAIRNHTLGRPGMDALSCVVFVADAIEPNRGDTPELNALRESSERDLHRCVRQTCDYSLQYLLTTERPIHPRTVLTRNWALQIVKGKPTEARSIE